MSTIHELINLGKCAQFGFSGTNNDFCLLDIARIKKLLRLPNGYKFPADFDPTQDKFNLLIQSGKLTPLYKLVDSTFVTEANEVTTFADGSKKQSGKKPYEIESKMINGVQGYQNTLPFEKSPSHSFLLVDENNNIFGFYDKNGLFGGISSEFFNVEPYVGGAEASYMVRFQLDRNQFDSGIGALRSEDYSFEIDDIKGYSNVIATIPVAPTTGATSFSFQLVRKEDKVPQLGATASTLKVYVDGTAVSSPTISAPTSAGVYTVSALTALTLGQTVKVKTNDGTYDIVEVVDTLLKSNEATTVVVAP